MKQEKTKGLICGISKNWISNGYINVFEYEIIGVPYTGHRNHIFVIAYQPEFNIGDVVEISIKKSSIKVSNELPNR